jgi:hypothetical protein
MVTFTFYPPYWRPFIHPPPKHVPCRAVRQTYHLGPFYTSAQNAAFETPHKTRANADRTFKCGTIKNRRVRIYTSASDAFKSALAQRQAFLTRLVALPTLAFVNAVQSIRTLGVSFGCPSVAFVHDVRCGKTRWSNATCRRT